MISSNSLKGNFMYGPADMSDIVLSITNDGGNKKIKIDDYEIPVKELVACLKAMRSIAKEQYPEDFI